MDSFSSEDCAFRCSTCSQSYSNLNSLLLHVQTSSRHADDVWRSRSYRYERPAVSSEKIDDDDRLVIDLTPSPQTSPCVEPPPPHLGDIYDSYTKRISSLASCSLQSVTPQQLRAAMSSHVVAGSGAGAVPGPGSCPGSCFPGSQVMSREGLSRLVFQQRYNAALARIAAATNAIPSAGIPNGAGGSGGSLAGNPTYFSSLPYHCLMTALPSGFSSYCMPAALSGTSLQEEKMLNCDASSICSSFFTANLAAEDSCAGGCTNSDGTITGKVISNGGSSSRVKSGNSNSPSASTSVVAASKISGATHSAEMGAGDSLGSVSGGRPPQRPVPNSKAVEEHISRLISENEALLEPSPVLLRRRTYTRQHSGSASFDQSALSSYAPHRLVPGATLLKACRSQSLVDSEMSCALSRSNVIASRHKAGALTALHFQKQVQEAMKDSMNSSFLCRFCNVNFRNEESVNAHEFRCAHRELSPSRKSGSSTLFVVSVATTTGLREEQSLEQHAAMHSRSPSVASPAAAATVPAVMTSATTVAAKEATENRHPLKKRILAQAENQKYSILPIVSSSPAPTAEMSFDGSRTPGFTAGIDSSALCAPLIISPLLKRTDQASQQSDLSLSLSALSSSSDVNMSADSKFVSDMQADYGTSIVTTDVSRVAMDSALPSVVAAASGSFSGSASFSASASVSDVAGPSAAGTSQHSNTCFRPYCVTVRVPHMVDMEPMRSCKRPAQVTQSTYCCVRRPTPISSLLDHNCRSSYAVWPQKPVNFAEAQMNVLMMAGCNMNQKHSHYKYITTNKLSRQMRMTHSSYWEYSKKLQKLAVDALITSTSTSAPEAPPLALLPPPPNVTDVEMSSVSCKASIDTDSVFSSPIASDVDASVSSGLGPVILCEPGGGGSGTYRCWSEASGFDSTTVVVKSVDSRPLTEEGGDDSQASLTPKVNLLNSSSGSGSLVTSVSTSLLQQRDRYKELPRAHGRQISKKVRVCNGGYKTNESYTYVRGRGRGRYVCEQCGIRCKKPSMLKKHIRSHLDVRPFACPQCSFSFKTKGNLTKHMKSKSHSRKCAFMNSKSVATHFRSPASYHDDFNDRSDDDEESTDTVSYSGGDAEEDIECRRSRAALWQRIQSGCYVGRKCRTPPSFYQKEQSECIDRCESAPSSFDIPTNVAAELCIAPATVTENVNEHRPTSRAADVRSFPLSSPPLLTAATVGAVGTATGSAVCELSKIEPFISSSACESKVECDICGKVFSKIGLLRLHMNVHIFERSSRRYDFKCSSCNCGFRSRSLLQKHVSTAHPRHEKDDVGAADGACGSGCVGGGGGDAAVASSCGNDSSSTAGSLNPRPFECVDCSIAFRIHGHLAKHLRSKLHIMKLECLGKIPIGTFARLEEAGVRYFLEIDTSDCQNSLKSLLSLNEQLDASSSKCHETCSDGPSSSKGGDSAPTKNDLKRSGGGDSMDTSSRSDLVAYDIHKDGCGANTTSSQTSVMTDSFGTKTFLNKDQNRSIVAGLWVPPKVTELAVSASDARKDYQGLENGGDSIATSSELARVSNSLPFRSSGDALKKPQALSQTYCKFCALSFSSAIDLEVHWHADHVVMKDGKDYKCPRDNCDKVYPNKESLRQHIALHFLGRLNIDYDAADVSKATVVTLSRKLNGVSSDSMGQLADDSGGRAPKRMKTHLVKLNVLPDVSGGRSEQQTNTTNNLSNCASPVSDSDTSRASVSGQSASSAPSPFDAVTYPKTVAKCCSSTKMSVEEGAPAIPGSKRTVSGSSEQPSTSFTNNTAAFVPVSALFHDEVKCANVGRQNKAVSAAGANSGVGAGLRSGLGSPNLFPVNQNAVLPAAVWNVPSFYANPVSPQAFYLTAAAAATPLSLLTYQNDHPTSDSLHLISNAAWMNLRALSPQLAASLYLNSLPKPRLFNPADAATITERSLQSSNVSADAQLCLICGKQFFELSAFQQHVISHSQFRPFVCEYCDAGFTTWQALESHLPCRFQ